MHPLLKRHSLFYRLSLHVKVNNGDYEFDRVEIFEDVSSPEISYFVL